MSVYKTSFEIRIATDNQLKNLKAEAKSIAVGLPKPKGVKHSVDYDSFKDKTLLVLSTEYPSKVNADLLHRQFIEKVLNSEAYKNLLHRKLEL